MNDTEFPTPNRRTLKERGLRGMVEDYERHLILYSLEVEGGSQRRAAEALGVLPSTLCEKMKRLGIHSRVSFFCETEHHTSDVA